MKSAYLSLPRLRLRALTDIGALGIGAALPRRGCAARTISQARHRREGATGPNRPRQSSGVLGITPDPGSVDEPTSRSERTRSLAGASRRSPGRSQPVAVRRRLGGRIAERIVLILALMLAPIGSASAHSSDAPIDELMAEREPAFEHSDGRLAPPLNGTAADGSTVRLDGLQDKILVVSFAPAVCGSPCIAQQALLRAVQEGVNITSMRDRVTFLTVGVASVADLDRSNWLPVTVGDGAAKAAASFAALSARTTYAPMIHVIDRGGRHAAIFHGAEFARTNLIVYINALTNTPPPESGWLDSILRAFQ